MSHDPMLYARWRAGASRRLMYWVIVAFCATAGAAGAGALLSVADTSRGGPALPRTPGMGGPIMLGLPGGGRGNLIVTRAPNGALLTVPPTRAPEPATLALLAAAVVALGAVRCR